MWLIRMLLSHVPLRDSGNQCVMCHGHRSSESKDGDDGIGSITTIVAADAVPADVKFVIAGCHSLAFIAYVHHLIYL